MKPAANLVLDIRATKLMEALLPTSGLANAASRFAVMVSGRVLAGNRCDRWMPLASLGWAVVTLLYFCLNASAASTGVHIAGKLHYESPFDRIPEEHYRFNCLVDSETTRWRIELAPDATTPAKELVPGSDRSILRPPQVLSSDGVQFYRVADTQGMAPIPGIRDRGLASLGPGSKPFGDVPTEMICIWYAFASSSYLAERKKGRIHPLEGVTFDQFKSFGAEVHGEWQLSSEFPYLPTKILTSNYDNTSTGANDLQELRNKGLVPMNVEMVANQVSVAQGRAIPRTVEVTYYAPPPKGGKDRVLSKKIRIDVESVGSLEAPVAFRPDLNGHFVVQDHNAWFRSPPIGLGVFATNSWPEPARLASRYEARKQYEAKKNLKPRLISPLIVVLFLALPLGIWWLNRKHKKQPNSKP